MPGKLADDVVLVHGWGGSFASTWESTGFTMLLEEEGLNVIGVDLLGHGEAPKPHDPAAYGDLGARVRDALPDRPVAAIGFSMGALTLLRLAMEQPDRFAGLVLAGIGGSILTPDVDGHAAILAALEAPADALGELPTATRIFRQYAEQPGNDLAALTAVMRRPPAAPFTDEALAAISCPVHIVIGDRDNGYPAEPLAEKFADASVTTLRNVDHFATTEAFGFVDAALKFLT
jgi:pimeloyl-ACP methyl ester carboxylesterase